MCSCLFRFVVSCVLVCCRTDRGSMRSDVLDFVTSLVSDFYDGVFLYYLFFFVGVKLFVFSFL